VDIGQLASRYPVLYHMAEDGKLRRDVRDEPCPPRPRYVSPHRGPPQGKAVIELAEDYAVPDAADLIGRVGRWRGGQELEEVWRKG
jgi:hypothetical protein